MDNSKKEPVAYNQRLFSSFNDYFTSSHTAFSWMV